MGLLESVSFINWEHESFPDYGDFVALPFFALFFFCVRFSLDRFVFEVPCFVNPIELFFFYFFSYLFCLLIFHNLVPFFHYIGFTIFFVDPFV